MAVELGVLIPTREAIMSGRPETAPLLTMAERAEAAGFDSVWIGDSITARPRHEPLTLMAAIAARTRRVRLGTGVLLPALRNPVVLAHLVGTVDRVAEGRVILGVGIAARRPGRSGRSSRRAACRGTGGWAASSRRSRSAARCGRATASRSAASTSRWRASTVEPKPHRAGRPARSGSAAAGPPRFREAARFDAWFPTGPSVEFFAEHFPRIQAAARAAGRPADAVARRGLRHAGARPEQGGGRAAPAHASSRPTTRRPPRRMMARQATYAGPVEGCVEWLQRWIDAGARHLALRFAGGDQLAQVDEAAKKLLPRLR